jgi:hypothetical protein
MTVAFRACQPPFCQIHCQILTLRRQQAAPATPKASKNRRGRVFSRYFVTSRSFSRCPEILILVWTLQDLIIPQPKKASPASSGKARISAQPIALTAAALLLIIGGVASIASWRAYTGHSPETDRAILARAMQARTAQASEQLVEKTRGLEQTQQESIDQLQVVQDQLQTVRRLLAAQQTDTKRLSEQVAGLTEAVDGLRHSFASAQANDATPAPASRNRSVRNRAHAARTHQRRVKSRS